jgi:hypothetical protein
MCVMLFLYSFCCERPGIICLWQEFPLTPILSCPTAAARALIDLPEFSAEDVARKAMTIAADMCVYTNKEFRVETLETKEKSSD